jgi:dihydrofolate reductase
MRNIKLNLAVSLDGFIARKDGRVDWLDDIDTGGSDLGFTKFLNSCDTIIMGRNSYEVTLKLGNGVWPFNEHTTVVFTSKDMEDKKNIVFYKDQLSDFLIESIKAEGKDIWLFGGSGFINSVMKLDMVDEYHITTIPVILGEGIKLFENTFLEKKLLLVSSETVNNIVTCQYKVIK